MCQVREVGGDGMDRTVPDFKEPPAERGRTHVKTTLVQGCPRDLLPQRLHAELDHQTAFLTPLLLPVPSHNPALSPTYLEHLDTPSGSIWQFFPLPSLLEAATVLRTAPPRSHPRDGSVLGSCGGSRSGAERFPGAGTSREASLHTRHTSCHEAGDVLRGTPGFALIRKSKELRLQEGSDQLCLEPH